MSSSDNTFELSAWLTRQSTELRKAWATVEAGTHTEEAVSQLEEIVRRYVEKADEGSIFETVFGYENIVFDAQETLAAAYTKLGCYDDALFLHRYVAETVQAIVRGRDRNQQEMGDVRGRDIDHLGTTAAFLVSFTRHKAEQGDVKAARQLLNEAIRLSDTWNLQTKLPELRRMINEQANALRQE
jgi:hypothetical protein